MIYSIRSFSLACMGILSGIGFAMADNWAVIAVGSNMYYNYRHQADGCHAYQTLRNRGIPAENIIMLSYDDIPTLGANPIPGTLFNHPSTNAGDEINVYENCHISYRGDDTTKTNFLAVLTGDAQTTNGKPVLTSDADDTVIVYFVDHGAVGMLGMPVGEYLFADELHTALLHMHDHAMYGKMILLIEACESGSLFAPASSYNNDNATDIDLSLPSNIFAITASNEVESSFATYCGSDSIVNGFEIGTCLGDEFSVRWLDNLEDDFEFGVESVGLEFDLIRDGTYGSSVSRYGDETVMESAVSSFFQLDGTVSSGQGIVEEKKKKKRELKAKLDMTTIQEILQLIQHHTSISSLRASLAPLLSAYSAESSRNVPLLTAVTQFLSSSSSTAYGDLMRVAKERVEADEVFSKLSFQQQQDDLPDDEGHFDCVRRLMKVYEDKCAKWNDYSFKYVKDLHEVCAGGETDGWEANLEKVCADIKSKN